MPRTEPIAHAASPSALRWLLLALGLGLCITVAPLWPSLVLAVWCAALARPLLLRLSRVLRGRHRAAAVITLLLLVLIVVPLAVLVVSLSVTAIGFGQKVAASPDGASALRRIVSDSESAGLSLAGPGVAQIICFAEQHGATAIKTLRIAALATARGLLAILAFFLAAYAILADGPQAYAWAEEHAPIAPRHLRRLADAFVETGRGLFIGIGLTALIQGALSTLVYLALRIPSALLLGPLTGLAALIPGVGTSLVWIPVAAGLAFTGRWLAALALVAAGLFVIGLIDNLLRPLLARLGGLQLPVVVLVLAAFAGLAAHGPRGLLLGPLLVRLLVEGLHITREEHGALSRRCPRTRRNISLRPSWGPDGRRQ